MHQQILIIFFILISGCYSKPGNIAPEKNFRFIVKSNSSSETAERNKLYLEKNIPACKYAISNSSGRHWPYYQAFELEKAMHKDSLMPPHSFVHKMIPFDKVQEIKDDEFFVYIEIFVLPDTLPNYSVSVFRKEKNEIQLSASTGIHFIQPSEFKSQEELSDLFLKNILRYSFK
ncbi:MAG: hypothetical protein ABIR06_22760 [Cyclobacteriaceae bacterium]